MNRILLICVCTVLVNVNKKVQAASNVLDAMTSRLKHLKSFKEIIRCEQAHQTVTDHSLKAPLNGPSHTKLKEALATLKDCGKK